MKKPLLSQRGLWLSIAAIAVDDDLIKQVFGVFLDMSLYTVVEVLSFLLYSGHLLIDLNGIHRSDCKKNGASCRQDRVKMSVDEITYVAHGFLGGSIFF